MDREIMMIASSAAMRAGERGPMEAGEKRTERLQLDLAGLTVGMSLSIPIELAHEPSLRVRISRENAKGGKQYRLMKHSHPVFVYEIGCIDMKFPKPEDV